jgi:serine-protein kinase ATM
VLKAQAIESTDDPNQPLSTVMPSAAVVDTAQMSADRAVETVMSKLSSALGIEYTVNGLIQDARDPRNLGAIFHGWQPLL